MTKEIKNFSESPILKNLIFKKKKKKTSYCSIEQYNTYNTCYNHLIYQLHRSILSNLAQFHKILKSLKNIRTLISKISIHHKNFNIKACESYLYDARTKTHDLVLIKNIKNPKFLKSVKILENAWNYVIWSKRTYLKFLKKTFEALTKKTTKKILWKGIEREIEEKDKKLLKKSYLIPICF